MADKFARQSVLRLFLFVLAMFFAFNSAAAQKTFDRSAADFKTLGGPADEIASMRLPAPADFGNRSKSAMILLNGGDKVREIEIPVDAAENFKLMLLSPHGENLSLEVSIDGESFFDLRGEGLRRGVTRSSGSFGFDGNQFPAEVFSFESIKPGALRVRVAFAGKAENAAEGLGYLVASSDSPYRLYTYLDTYRTVVGRPIGFGAAFFSAAENAESARPQIKLDGLRTVAAVLRAPDGKTIDLAFDNDADGDFATVFTPSAAGRYRLQITARGTTPENIEFVRTAEHVFEVENPVTLRGANARAALVDDLRWRVELPATGLARNGKVIVHAEIWGRDRNGEFPVAWSGGMQAARTAAGRGAFVPLTIDSRWLAQTPTAEAFELRNVRLQNPDNLVVVGEIERVALPALKTTELARSFAGLINDEMRQGVRPPKDAADAVGGKLMLVHGYCSGDAWGATAAAGQFTEYVKFLDLNQNRSHDQFANLIRNFGASLPSFGIVAHSQGGAASLHLYTYYWSGLDYATGPRLIQSVGTPFQGTALAGNLAALGSVFGAGCGSNYDLTYAGSAAWLANIPSWARSRVFYHTTSFTDVWWRYDYCNLATDLFLGDPDDGVVERAYAQLSGAVNLGHKTGWCHTGGMRDPAQTGDRTRNLNMNANAAR